MRQFQFSLRTMFLAVAVVATGVALRYQMLWIIWGGVLVVCFYLSLSNISTDYRDRQI